MRKIVTILLTVLLLTVTVYALPEVYEIPMNCDIPEGAYGVWQVPCIGTRTPLYISKGTGQNIIDAEDSALYQRYGKGYAIYDHAWSEVGNGCWCVEQMEVGCGAFLCREGKPEICYECTAIYLTKQNGTLYKCRGSNITIGKNEIMCLSCAEDDGWVYVAVFEKVGEMP